MGTRGCRFKPGRRDQESTKEGALDDEAPDTQPDARDTIPDDMGTILDGAATADAMRRLFEGGEGVIDTVRW